MAAGLLRDLVGQVFTIVAAVDEDLVTSLTYRQIATGVYDPATDTVAETPTDTTVADAVLAKFKRDEIREGVFEHADQKLLIAADRLPGITPAVNDRIVIATVVWNVEEIMGVPGSSLHILRIREA